MDKKRESIKIKIKFYDVKIGKPMYRSYQCGKIMPLYPNHARLSSTTYSAPLSLAMDIKLTAYYSNGQESIKNITIPSFQVTKLPIMIGSTHCHTWNITREVKKALCEDPTEEGGYFIAKGGEWSIEWLENITFNQLHLHANMNPTEYVRGEFISQAGGAFENSSQIVIRYMTNGSITVEVNSTRFSKVKIPFYLFFRMFGLTSDREIIEHIVYDLHDTSADVVTMTDIVATAIQFTDPKYADIKNELDRVKIIEFIAAKLSPFVTNYTAYKADESAIQYLNTQLLQSLDTYLLPHIGKDSSSRIVKLRFLGMLINRVLLVHMEVLEPTDRDSYANKRVHGAAVSYAKIFKTTFNQYIIIPALHAIKRELKNNEFETLPGQYITNAIMNSLGTSDLHRSMEMAITGSTLIFAGPCNR